MKTTVIIDDAIMTRVKREASNSGKTISEFVELALRTFLRGPRRKRSELPPLPSFDGGGCTVDVSDRDSLYGAMEGR